MTYFEQTHPYDLLGAFRAHQIHILQTGTSHACRLVESSLKFSAHLFKIATTSLLRRTEVLAESSVTHFVNALSPPTAFKYLWFQEPQAFCFIRPIIPTDASAAGRLLRSLSVEEIGFRFFVDEETARREKAERGPNIKATKDRIRQGKTIGYAAFVGNEMVALVELCPPKPAHLYKTRVTDMAFAVNPAYRRHGLARIMEEMGKDHATRHGWSILLEVHTRNIPMLGFAHKQGYIPVDSDKSMLWLAIPSPA